MDPPRTWLTWLLRVGCCESWLLWLGRSVLYLWWLSLFVCLFVFTRHQLLISQCHFYHCSMDVFLVVVVENHFHHRAIQGAKSCDLVPLGKKPSVIPPVQRIRLPSRINGAISAPLC